MNSFDRICVLPSCGYAFNKNQHGKDCPLCGYRTLSAGRVERLSALVQKRAEQVTPERLNELKSKRAEFEARYENQPTLRKVWSNVLFLWDVVYSDDVPFHYKALAAAALLYVISPVDLIPDFIPIVGYLDDLAVILLVIYLMMDAVIGLLKKEASTYPVLTIACVDHKPHSAIEQRIVEGDVLLAREDAESLMELGLSFHDGLPSIGSFYFAHPILRNRFVPISDPDLLIQKEQWAELDRMFAAMNAKSIKVSMATSDATKGAIAARIQKVFGGSGDATSERSSKRVMVCTKGYEDTGKMDWESVVKSGTWLFDDQSPWALFQQRLFSGLSAYSMKYELDSRLALQAKAASKVPKIAKNAGIEVSGSFKFERQVTLSLSIDVEFHPSRRQEMDEAATKQQLASLVEERTKMLKRFSAEVL